MSSPYQRFAYHTFGCKVNFADSSTISRSLLGLGYSYVSTDMLADIYIINTEIIFLKNLELSIKNFGKGQQYFLDMDHLK